ncbi:MULTISPECIES: recombinase family protein [unclassified Knoellia]|uniref:recombinase family protein n=1 Tax=Knoellia altitudinis TaxID=3404795 RepID=UPI00361F1322
MREDPSDAPKRAAIYARISADSEGERLGVMRQEEDCRARAKREGLEVVDLYVDNDISASTKSKKARPEFERMMSDARAHRVDVILAYSNSRLTRRPREMEDLIEHHKRYGTRFLTVVSGDDDLSTADGRMVARIKGNVDTAEAERIGERLRRHKRQMAERGLYRGGMRPYGFEKDGTTIRADEARVVQKMSKAVLAGRTLASLAKELNQKGSTTSTGREWTYARLRDVLVRPRNAGLLSRGRADRDPKDFEIVGQASWKAIVSEEEWRAVRDLLTDPSRRAQDGNETRWLGSGIYTCGVRTDDGGACGSPLRPAPYGGTEKRGHEKRYLYRCTATAHLTISSEPTDEHVRAVVAEMVRDPRVVASLVPADLDLTEDRERRTVLLARLEQTERDYDADLIDARRFKAKSEKITAELQAVDARLAQRLRRSTASPVLGAADPGAAFLAAPVDVQRALLRSLLRVEVRPAIKGAAWTSDRLRITRPGQS